LRREALVGGPRTAEATDRVCRLPVSDETRESDAGCAAHDVDHFSVERHRFSRRVDPVDLVVPVPPIPQLLHRPKKIGRFDDFEAADGEDPIARDRTGLVEKGNSGRMIRREHLGHDHYRRPRSAATQSGVPRGCIGGFTAGSRGYSSYSRWRFAGILHRNSQHS
jgi:hypothetical protein